MESAPSTIIRRPLTLSSVDDRMIALMRFTLALSALLIIWIDPSEPDHFVIFTYISLLVYAFYSAIIYLLSTYRPGLIRHSIALWIDIACYLIFISLSSGTNSVFFFFFFFSVLVASFRGGFKEGISAAVVSSVLFTIVGYISAPPHEFQLNRFLLRPTYLLVLGYLMAYWGGHEIKLKQRLSLLREVINLSNPRFGVSHTIGSMLAKIQSFYDADGCFLVLIDPVYKDTRLFSLERGQLPERVRAEQVPPKIEELLLSFPDNIAIIRQGRARLKLFRNSQDLAFDLVDQRKCTGDWQSLIDSVASKLELGAFVSVPLHYRGKRIGRLYLTVRQRIFGATDVDFLMQVIEQMIPVVHNISLLSRLASNAAEQERQRLARDLHDSVIQPYLGLQYKLAAIRNKVGERKDASQDIEQLFRTTVHEINSLRGFVRGLKEGEAVEANFVAAVRRFAAQFSESYDLDILVESKGEVEISDRLAAQLVRIVQEGLSNVRKHTNASICRITVERAEAMLLLSIANDNPQANGGGYPAFFPRSIAERSEDLGGHASVEQRLDGYTAVKVEIPL